MRLFFATSENRSSNFLYVFAQLSYHYLLNKLCSSVSLSWAVVFLFLAIGQMCGFIAGLFHLMCVFIFISMYFYARYFKCSECAWHTSARFHFHFYIMNLFRAHRMQCGGDFLSHCQFIGRKNQKMTGKVTTGTCCSYKAAFISVASEHS